MLFVVPNHVILLRETLLDMGAMRASLQSTLVCTCCIPEGGQLEGKVSSELADGTAVLLPMARLSVTDAVAAPAAPPAHHVEHSYKLRYSIAPESPHMPKRIRNLRSSWQKV